MPRTGYPEALPVCDDDRGQLRAPGLAGRAAHQAAAVGRRGTSIAGNLGASLRAVLTDVGKVTDVVSFTRSDAATLAKLGSGLTADRNMLQGPLGGAKQRSWVSPVPVAAVKAAGRGTGGTVNDVVLTAITSALRQLPARARRAGDQCAGHRAGQPAPAGSGAARGTRQ